MEDEIFEEIINKYEQNLNKKKEKVDKPIKGFKKPIDKEKIEIDEEEELLSDLEINSNSNYIILQKSQPSKLGTLADLFKNLPKK